jgi:hypothetical protein
VSAVRFRLSPPASGPYGCRAGGRSKEIKNPLAKSIGAYVVPKNRFPKKEKVINGPGPEKNRKSRKSWLKNKKSGKKA